jgi:hypothetical protein
LVVPPKVNFVKHYLQMPLPAYPGLFKGHASLVSFDGTTALINVAPDDKTEGLMLSIPVPVPTEDKEPGITMQMVGRWPERAESNPVISHCIVANWRDSDGRTGSSCASTASPARISGSCFR